jgi:hypothetical protein
MSADKRCCSAFLPAMSKTVSELGKTIPHLIRTAPKVDVHRLASLKRKEAISIRILKEVRKEQRRFELQISNFRLQI